MIELVIDFKQSAYTYKGTKIYRADCDGPIWAAYVLNEWRITENLSAMRRMIKAAADPVQHCPKTGTARALYHQEMIN